jgi:hypothetical protein
MGPGRADFACLSLALRLLARVRMKVERKLFNFSVEKWKRSKNIKTKTEICGTEMETEFFWWKWKRKRNGVFWRN